MVDEDFAWRLVQELVRIDSSDPGAYENEIEHFIKRLVEQQLAQLDSPALDAVQIEELEVLPGRRNLMVTVPGLSDEPRLVYICHMDTVTLGDGWDAGIPPLGAIVRDDILYGRGACDMKGGLACAIAALVHTLERVAADGALPRRGFSLICSVDEEDFMRGSEAAIDAGWIGSREWVLDTEPTDGQIQVAHKGRTWFEIEMTGVTAHASQPLKGADAVAAMAEAVCSLRHAFAALPVHDELGPSTITFGQIEGGYRPYVVPDHAKVWVDMRLTPPTNTAAAINMVEWAIVAAEAAVPGCHGSCTVTGDRPAIERDPSSLLLAALKRAADDVTDADTTVGFFTGYTDTAVIAGKTGNRNCMSYGPGSLALAHKPNEYVPRADIVRCQQVLIALADNTLWDASGQVGA
ncbi:M20 family metallopeptidase [Collinsella aerofaciens]|uniref:M20 family metallopeptidase n=1 Tax=Collinsella aerofaciens TaxID=74426 RepID=UPI0018979871|nr:M20 family metallopeptidase [Collinsella aerofaciens]MDB1845537.1 M20 family metallopeptidase [Collinsella aerofaciens]MDB1847614.1 M20 family metallopeptidase [Collinsella aerofaciens]MDB1853071.1 M20 family metallopeptidase [Collinsella aerofaciens]